MSTRDWSSDVCSSDLKDAIESGIVVVRIPPPRLAALDRVLELGLTRGEIDDVHLGVRRRVGARDVKQARRRELGVGELALDLHRSEERRVGRGGRGGG